MAQGMNPAAPHHLPPFITAPGQTDVFLVGSAIFLIAAVITLGSLYFRLHALPEHLAHGKASKLQFEVVAVLALLALFTHNSWFWVAALLLAIIPVPDLYGPLARMADSLTTMAGWRRQRSGSISSDEAAPASRIEEPLTVAASFKKPLPRTGRAADLPPSPSIGLSDRRPQPERPDDSQPGSVRREEVEP
jgi:hypothetical protein